MSCTRKEVRGLMKDKKYWVIQVIRGVYNAYGPYVTSAGARHRYEKTSGGEVFLHDSWEEEPQKAIDEFKAEKVGV